MKKILITIEILLFTPLLALASGIQVSPARLDFSVAGGGVTSQSLTVVNPTPDVQLFEIYPDNFAEQIKPEPTSFTLEAGAKKTVTVAVSGNARALGQILITTVSVVGNPLSGGQNFSVGAGVKIPVSIIQTVQTNPPNRQKQIASLFLAAGLIFVGLWSTYIHKTKKLPC
jgi:hypothetical protein